MTFRKSKKNKLLIALLLTFSVTMFCSEKTAAQAENKSVSEADLKSAKIALVTLKGMTCQGCAVKIKTNLNKVPGVLKADFNFEAQQGTVYIDRNSTTGEAELTEAAEKCGFNVSDFKWRKI